MENLVDIDIVAHGRHNSPVGHPLEVLSAVLSEGLAVTLNLAEASHYLRLREQPRVLLVDAICVDQGNQEERDSRIRTMAGIYGNAFKVIIQIASASDDNALAI